MDCGRTVLAKDEQFNSLIARIGKKINLKPHIAGESEKPIWTAVDTEGHWGRDGRYCIQKSLHFDY